MIDEVAMRQQLRRQGGADDRILALVHAAEISRHRAKVVGQWLNQGRESGPIDIERRKLIADEKTAAVGVLAGKLFAQSREYFSDSGGGGQRIGDVVAVFVT